MIPGIGTLINSFAVIGVGILTRFFVKKEIKNYRIISCPGCYPTSIQIPLIPLLSKKLIKNEKSLIKTSIEMSDI